MIGRPHIHPRLCPWITPCCNRCPRAARGRSRAACGCPGDKSISHRAADLRGAGGRRDPRSAGCWRAKTPSTPPRRWRRSAPPSSAPGPGAWRIRGVGVGGLAEPAAPLDFGNSGTGCRLMMGVVAGCPIVATFDGDASLRTRPMRRILDPLERMGARILEIAEGGRLPLRLEGARDPIPIDYEAPVAVGPAQVGGAARRPCGAGRHHGDRARGDPRPYREAADAFRRGGPGRAARRARPPDHAHRPAGTGAGAGGGAGRSVVGRVSAGRGADRAGLRDRDRGRDAQPAAGRTADHAAGDGCVDRDAGAAQRGRRGRRRPAGAQLAPSRASKCRPSVRRP